MSIMMMNTVKKVHNVAASVHNIESLKYQTYNDTICNTTISDIYRLRDQVSSDTDFDTDSISDARQETPTPFSTIAEISIIGKPVCSPVPFDMSKFTKSYQHHRDCHIGQHRTHIVKN